MTIQEMKERLKRELSPHRFLHSLGVMNTAIELAKVYGAEPEKAATAGILHDCAKHVDGREAFRLCRKYGIIIDPITALQPQLLHGPLGAYIAKDVYGVGDREIIEAIKCHTTGKENMSLLDKIIFISDYIEPERDFCGVEEIRDLAYRDLDAAMLGMLRNTVMCVMSKGALVHCDTIKAWNYIIKEGIK